MANCSRFYGQGSFHFLQLDLQLASLELQSLRAAPFAGGKLKAHWFFFFFLASSAAWASLCLGASGHFRAHIMPAIPQSGLGIASFYSLQLHGDSTEHPRPDKGDQMKRQLRVTQAAFQQHMQRSSC